MKPHVTCLMMSSLDGRLTPSRWTTSPDGSRDAWSASYAEVHDTLKADAWMVGRVTMAEMARGKPHAPDDASAAPRPHHFAAKAAKPFAIALDASGKLHFARADIGGDHVIVVLGRDVPDRHLAELAGDGISYIVSDTSEIDLAAVLAVLKRELDIQHVALEGGGGINGTFFAAGLVDELIVLVAPALDGQSDSRAIVDSGAVGLNGKVTLSLTDCTQLDHGLIQLRYAAKPV